MALSAKLSLRQSQSMVMTPQLLQSIRLLQFTQLELDRFVQQQIEGNPLLEGAARDGGEDASGGEDRRDDRADADSSDDGWASQDLEVSSGAIADKLDSSLENVFPDDPGRGDDFRQPGSVGPSLSGPVQAGADVDLEQIVAGAVTLRDHIVEQIGLTIRDPAERAIAFELADMIDPNGYIEAGFGDMAERLGCGEEEIEATLGKVQAFDPPGLFARDLSECLGLQLARLNRFDPAMKALIENLPLLAKRDFRALTRICGVEEADLVDMLAEIRALDPRPGLAFDHGAPETIVHDVEVREAPDGTWLVELNADALPRIIVNRDYYATVSRSRLTVEEKSYMSECLQNATWLERTLDQRATTILKVATEIVRRQDAFLARGVSALRPMTMKMVAEAIGMHESTVSRVASNKFMLTPRGMFEFRYFFTAAIGGGDAGEEGHSAEAVRQRIRGLIDAETPAEVLSDDALVSLLRKEGIDVARRTVAKYREGMNIASSVQRRREKRAMATVGG